MSEDKQNHELTSAPDAPDDARAAKKSATKFAKRAFIKWLATPEQLRFPTTAREFAAQNHVHESTLSSWKGKLDVTAEVRRLVLADAAGEIADILASLKRVAREGSVPAIKLYLEFVLGWVDGSTSSVIENNISVSFGDEHAIPFWRGAKEDSKEN